MGGFGGVVMIYLVDVVAFISSLLAGEFGESNAFLFTSIDSGKVNLFLLYEGWESNGIDERLFMFFGDMILKEVLLIHAECGA